MIKLKLDTKSCMASLLLHEDFDQLSLIECEITTFSTFSIDGLLKKEFFDVPPEKEYIDWKDVRKYCLSLISGTKTPLDFKFVFSYPKNYHERLLQSFGISFPADVIRGLYLNIQFDGENLYCTTGTSFSTFLLDKSLESLWDDFVKATFTKKKIPWEMIS